MRWPRFFWPFQPGGTCGPGRGYELDTRDLSEITFTSMDRGAVTFYAIWNIGEGRRIDARHRLAVALWRVRVEAKWWGIGGGGWSAGAIPARCSNGAELNRALDAHIDLSQNAPLDAVI